MEEEIVVKEEAAEAEVKEEVEIKQEVAMGDEDVEEEVGNRWAVEDEVEGDLMIKREDGLTDPLGEESDVLEGSSGVQRNALDVLIDMNSDADISVDIFIEPPNPAELSDDDSGNEENEIQELSGICHVIDC
ncbi:hypothetical protein GE061_008812 [Apolygus lucorum]|uniref:Uncharacterized protein n=1 Tax=Apolygus lucorum TaxID=248454 RepID=A0A8S9WLN2_APOLU|nr:hypothetical protein GE061_008812 [Apolygus lucorum]